MDGLLVIDKPEGPTSHDVVARMRRALRERRIGHTGTLDPMASGVLPLVVGVATRLARFHSGSAKRYLATVAFGATTDTYDAKGAVTWQAPGDAAPPSGEQVDAALERFRGTFAQVPPAYSAKKVDGDRAYDLARKGTAVALEAVEVTVERLELVSYACGGQVLKNAAMKDVTPSAVAVVDVTASAGFYVRALAFDLGQALGCGAYLAALRRTASGLLTEAQALPLDDAERGPETALARLVPLRDMLREHPAVVLSDAGATRARHGNLIRVQDVDDPTGIGPDPVDRDRVVRLVTGPGDLVAVAEIRANDRPWPLQPGVVLA